MIFYIIGFRIFKTYAGILRYSSFKDLQSIGYSTIFGVFCSYMARIFLGDYAPFSYLHGREIVVGSLIATLIMWLIRIIVKTVYDFVSQATTDAKNAYIYGSKEGGIGLAKFIQNEKPVRFILKGFATDEKELENYTVMGLDVHPIDERLLDCMKKDGVRTILIASSKINDFRNNDYLQDTLIKAGIKIYLSRQPKAWNGNSSHENLKLKEISIEDLLPRDEIQVDMEQVAQQITGTTVMITGSAGSIGSEIVKQIVQLNPKEMVLIDQAETPQHDLRLLLAKSFPQIKATTIVTSISNQGRMEAIFREWEPDYVFHAAAYKHVPMMEDNPSESVHNNVYGTKVIADLAVKYHARKFVMISTDKAVNPTNVMGCSKRICEIYVQSLDKAIKNGDMAGNTQFVTTRFGNVLGSNGSVIPLFKEQIKNGGPVTVTDPNIIRYFMLIPEACKLVLEAGTRGKGGEIFVFDMGKPVRIADLAERMILLSGAHNVKIKFTGLRPGEKLYEEVLNSEETTKPSFHQKIRIAKTREYDYNSVQQDIADLIAVSEQFDDMNTVKKMKEIVPEFKSNNSCFSALDK
jgi:FlaA1/EpsC-like NDP-sugar epimerase